MAQPYSFNLNSVTQQVLTTDGRVEELPIGSLRVPPPVGFQSVAECGGALGLCMGVAMEACYIVEGGFAIICGIVTLPAACITLVVLGVAIAICVLAGSIDEQFRAGCREIEARFAQAQQDCRDRHGTPYPGESLGQKLLREFALFECLQTIKRKIQQYIDELRKRLYNGGYRGPGNTIPGANPYYHM